MQAIVLAGGDVASRRAIDAAWPGWLAADTLVIAADGGARHAPALGLRIDRWIGDGDSTDPADLAALVAAGVSVEHVPTDKDASDTELAVGLAVDAGADEIVILGAMGGLRMDHALANIGLLALPSLEARRVVILDASVRITRLSAPDAHGRPVAWSLSGRVGDIVSLLTVGDGVAGVTTRGLRYPLSDEPLPAGPARGLSNVRLEPDAAVTVRAGTLLIVESPATLDA
jgi:thiamine pyrophosphokinase